MGGVHDPHSARADSVAELISVQRQGRLDAAEECLFDSRQDLSFFDAPTR